MTPRARTRLKIWLVVVGVFALGCVTGASLDSVYRLRDLSKRQEARGRHGKEDLFESMRSDLDLNPQQETELRAILDQTHNEYRALRTEVRPRYDALRQQARTRLRALLTQEQRQRFDAKAAERDARREENEKN
ncbi:MAG: hypothetical protein ACR2G4_11660 [Pyrinomonadaceae bacterium]